MKYILGLIALVGFLIVSEMSFREHMQEQLKDAAPYSSSITKTGTPQGTDQTDSGQQEIPGVSE